jgi:hypothetical protein
MNSFWFLNILFSSFEEKPNEFFIFIFIFKYNYYYIILMRFTSKLYSNDTQTTIKKIVIIITFVVVVVVVAIL